MLAQLLVIIGVNCERKSRWGFSFSLALLKWREQFILHKVEIFILNGIEKEKS